MAQPTNTLDTFDLNGIREQLANSIENVDPEETPFYSKCGKITANNTFTEWQTDTLRAAAANAHIEGNDTTATARTATTRLGNYTQIVKDAVVIADTTDAVDKAGRGREMVYQMVKVGAELKLDIERHAFTDTARVAGNSTTARQMASISSWMATNVDSNGAATVATGDGTDTFSGGTNRAFTQTLLNNAMQSAWNAGGKVDCLYASPSKVTAIAAFTGSNNQRNTVDKRELSYAVDVYMTSFGTVEIMPSRYIGDNRIFLPESDKWEYAVLRPFQQTDLAKTGDNTKKQMLTELTLCAKNEKASADIRNLT